MSIPLLDLLGAGSGTFIYHLLVLQVIGAMAVIALVNWRHTQDPEQRRNLWLFLSLWAVRLLLMVGEPLAPPLLAPVLVGLETAAVAALAWVFLAPLLNRHRAVVYVLAGLGAAGVGAVGFLWPWMRALENTPSLLYIDFWQFPLWQALRVILVLVPVVTLLRRREREEHWMVAMGFAVLGLGALMALLGSLLSALGALGEIAHPVVGMGRFVNLLGYPFLCMAVYRMALHDMREYHQELQEVSQEALRQRQGLLFLVEAGRATGEPLELDAILRRVAESATMALGADRVGILLTHPDDPEAVTLAAQYTPLESTAQPEARPATPLAEQPALAHAMQRGKQMVLNAETDNPRLQALYQMLGADTAGPTIVQPLLCQGRSLGVLVVGNDRSQRSFEPSDGHLCQSVSAQVAAAVENARLYRDLQTQASRLAGLLHEQQDETRRRAAILESVAEGIIVADEEGRIAAVNAAAEQILGVPRQRIQGQTLGQLAGHTALDPGASWGAIARSEAPLHTVFELEGKVVHISAAPVLTPTGERLGVVALLRDVTRETEADRARGQFIATVSHELRTPLTAIQGYAEALRGGMVGTVNEAQERFLSIIRDNVDRLAGLAENLVAVSQVEKGKVELVYGQVDLPLMVGETVRDHRGEFEERKLKVNLKIEDDLAPIEADPECVQQILDNLVTNAIKFTHPSGEVTIGAGLLREESGDAPTHCTLWVSDTGIGIPPEEQADVWDRFYRPSNPLAAEASGLGVGLSIVKALVEAHRGRVWLDSTLGEGSTFTVLLPVKRPQQSGA